MSFHGVKATGMTSLCCPRDLAPTRTCLSGPQHPPRSRHCHSSALGKSCSPPCPARGQPPLWEGFLLSHLCRWCHQQVSFPAFSLPNACPQSVAVGWGGRVIPCDMCQMLMPSAGTLFPSNPSQTWRPACPGLPRMQTKSTAPSCPGEGVFSSTRACPEQLGRVAQAGGSAAALVGGKAVPPAAAQGTVL